MPVNILITGLSSIQFVSANNVSESIPVLSIKEYIGLRKGIRGEDYYLVQDGRILNDADIVALPHNEGTMIINAFPRILGGKGGFGSLIRAMGKSTQKSQNTEACRDLSGRRMRDVSTEKKLAQWIKDAAEKKKEAEEEKKARRERRRAGPKHVFTDHEYMNQIQANAENIDDALKQGMAASGSSNGTGTKRPSTMQPPVNPKKIHFWSGVDDLSDEELDEESEESHHQGSGDEGTHTELSPLPDKQTDQDEDTNETDAVNKSSDNGLVGGKDTEDNKTSMTASLPPEGNKDESKATPSPESSKDESKATLTPECSKDESKEIKDEKVPEASDSISDNKASLENTPTSTLETFEAIDLDKYATAEELISAVTPEHLKVCLQKLGLKCGGTPAQRGQRLFVTKGKSLSELDPSMFAKPKKQKK